MEPSAAFLGAGASMALARDGGVGMSMIKTALSKDTLPRMEYLGDEE